jgi:hypothetical protein
MLFRAYSGHVRWGLFEVRHFLETLEPALGGMYFLTASLHQFWFCELMFFLLYQITFYCFSDNRNHQRASRSWSWQKTLHQWCIRKNWIQSFHRDPMGLLDFQTGLWSIQMTKDNTRNWKVPRSWSKLSSIQAAPRVTLAIYVHWDLG